MSRQLFDAQNPDGPIPGENMTSDERNYPWHRSPDITDSDEAVDYLSDKLTDTKDGFMYMNLLKADVTVAACVDMAVTQGISDGKWTPDFAILIAGPVARLFEIMAKSYKIKYALGVEEDLPPISPEVIDKRLERGSLVEPVDPAEAEALALEQEEMLGGNEDIPAFNTGGLLGKSPMAPSVNDVGDSQMSMDGMGAGVMTGAKLGNSIKANSGELPDE